MVSSKIKLKKWVSFPHLPGCQQHVVLQKDIYKLEKNPSNIQKGEGESKIL